MEDTSCLLLVDENEKGEKLYMFPENELFPSFAVFENCQGELELIGDMQGAQPEALDEVADYDWYRLDDLLLVHEIAESRMRRISECEY